MITNLYNQIIKEEEKIKDKQMRTLLISGNNVKKFMINFPDIEFSVYNEDFIKIIPKNWEENLKIVECLKWF